MHGNVVLNYRGFPKGELGVYGRAYLDAARHLVERVASGHYRGHDACPIVFLYRHAVELYLKSIIHWGNNLLWLSGKAEKTDKSLFKEHRLQVLLRSVKPILRFEKSLDNWGDPHFSSFRDAEKVIEELEELDPGSYSFRYPIDTTGKKASLPGHLCFNVVAFGEKFDHLVELLASVEMMVYEDFQSQAELYHETQQGMN